MTVSRAADLTVARSDVAAEHVAAAIWESVAAMEGTTATAEATRRLLRRHAHELLELHNIKADEVLTGTADTGGNHNGAFAAAIGEYATNES